MLGKTKLDEKKNSYVLRTSQKNFNKCGISHESTEFSQYTLSPKGTRVSLACHSRVQQPCKFIRTKKSIYIRKEVNSHRMVWSTNMAAMSLFAMVSCAYTLY